MNKTKIVALLCAMTLLLTCAFPLGALAQGGAPPEKPDGENGAPPEMPGGAPPDGMTPPDGMGAPPNGAPGGFGGGKAVSTGTGANTYAQDFSAVGAEYTSVNADENALRAENGATVSVQGATIQKLQGETSDTECSDFYGMNAGALALDGATLNILDSTITTAVKGGNAAFAYGEGTTLNITGTTITTSCNNSGGIDATGGAAINATDLTVVTNGNSAAAIRSDRGGGTVRVTGGAFTTNGTGSPAVYSTADISVTGATLTATASEAVVVEGKNSVALAGCTVSGSMKGTYGGGSGENIHNVMLYQSMSGDADVGVSSFAMTGGVLTSLAGDMFYVTNTSCEIAITGVTMNYANDVLLLVSGNDASRGWGRAGANGGACAFTAKEQTMAGNIVVDDISSLTLSLTENTAFTGSVNALQSAGRIDVTMDGSVWTLTGDSYVSSFTGDLAQVETDDYHLYVNGELVK